jgi:uncharacterized membrane protein YdjX (TVP38/TMEM64 family)
MGDDETRLCLTRPKASLDSHFTPAALPSVLDRVLRSTSVESRHMKHYLRIFLLICAALLVIFGVAQAMGLPVLEDPAPLLGRGGVATALVTTALLVVDVFVPVPSSLVMIANGAFFGVAGGTILTLVGAVGAAVLGWALGRWGSRPAERYIPAEERARARALVERWGALAVIASRPVPILAEAVAIAAGLSGMGLGRLAGAALLGSLPAAVLYAVTGATSARLDSALLVFGLVLAVAGAAWLIGTRAGGRLRSASPSS